MEKINLRLSAPAQKDSTIYIDNGLVEKIGSLLDLSQYTRVFVVTDRTVRPLLLDKLVAALTVQSAWIVLPDGDAEKNITSVQKIWEAMHLAGCDRQSVVINLGGGVVGDIGGFAASTYMRGVDFINVPTTLLAQVDASIGGKTGINFDGIKNLIGTFQHPIAIIIDPLTLQTLDKREFIAGFGEVIKHGLVWDKQHFKKVTAKPPLEFTPAELLDITTESGRIKLAIVEGDLKEGGARKLVNFGHTIGHAIEALSMETDNPLLHGEAISIGMVAEATISHELGLIKTEDLDSIKQALKHAELPISVNGLAIKDILAKMRSDKKNNSGQLNFTLIDDIGHAIFNQQVAEKVVTAALQAVIA